MNDAFVTTREDAELVMQRPSNDPIDKIERMEKALREIVLMLEHAKMTMVRIDHAKILRLCKEGLGE